MTVSRAAQRRPTASPGWVAGSLMALVLASCGAPVEPPLKKEEPAPLAWGYQGDLGPEHWAGLDPKFAACAAGTSQSPVDLAGAVERDLMEVVFNYAPTLIHLCHDDHMVIADCEAGNSIRVDKGTFDLVQFQFHRPSEHRLDGQAFPLEIQFLHRDSAGRMAAVAVLCRLGTLNPALDTFDDGLPSRRGEQGYLGKPVPLKELLPPEHRAYRYQGSLTSPPCTEPVLWIVLAQPLEISADQLKLFEAAIRPNSRPLQPLNGREILVN